MVFQSDSNKINNLTDTISITFSELVHRNYKKAGVAASEEGMRSNYFLSISLDGRL